MKKLLHSTRVDIPEKVRIELISLLNSTLASTADLYMQLKQAHWNIKGMSFIGVHKLLDEIAEQVEDQVDIVAERATALGGTALGTIEAVVENTQLPPYPIDIFKVEAHLEHLIHSIAILCEHARDAMDFTEEVGDMATNDVYVALTRLLEKNLWFLEAHLQK